MKRYNELYKASQCIERYCLIYHHSCIQCPIMHECNVLSDLPRKVTQETEETIDFLCEVQTILESIEPKGNNE